MAFLDHYIHKILRIPHFVFKCLILTLPFITSSYNNCFDKHLWNYFEIHITLQCTPTYVFHVYYTRAIVIVMNGSAANCPSLNMTSVECVLHGCNQL